MFDVIVVGTDGSESASLAVQRATELARMADGTLHIVSVFRPMALSGMALAAGAGAASIDMDLVNRGISSEAEQVCEHASSQARRDDVKFQVHSLPGDPADALVSVAQEVGADLVVVGNRGMSGARRFVLGSVPNKVSHHCPCSLLIVDTTVG
jgi:nucleotide-binding universal stress UspA family protein